ncbi:Transmembrane emp24 domain-containing protein 2 [Schistosoma japonicum]|uniref:Transmembrane emp24 domain-containing protein 2 n=2 Tax=Schistosoma japonicum TaxID=6182 RepID=C7TZ96_SCHJA|nr:Transmembrane emp24 domain-containing protein 2 [Schistosoma japonicum]CAX70318.1 Transmembrane emp24 domain-containing protein 2 precursor [Schistosoma japonicum]CAX74933.1 Transmembrane emp24 domain-containing protein 2 precursor [Schistosoma japonicum]CAX82922.1 Transmembrane emp24 domain-containing protein 2 precursor [Schistosoma japonicum]
MWTFVLFCISFFSSCHGYYIVVDANSEECFFDRVTSGSKLALHYEVAEGGFLDIDVAVYNPTGVKIFESLRKSNGRPEFTANEPGDYKYCFGNRMSSMTPKVVLFEMAIEEDQLRINETDDEEHKKLVSMVNELAHSISGVKLEMEYVSVRTQVHWEINKNTNFRVVVWAAFEAFLIIAMSIGQVFYLKRFFEVRRLV